MSIDDKFDKITKESWDKVFKKAITEVESNIHELSNSYIGLLQLRAQYRKEYKTHRIAHLYNGKEGIISYKVLGARHIGYSKNRKGDEDF